MSDNTLTLYRGARKKKKRLGRGSSSGTGCTAGKGSKGQNARSGGGVRPGFEGGQMPLYRRVARRGFSNAVFKKVYLIVNIDDLAKYNSGETVSRESLLQKGLIKKRNVPVKLLAQGDIKKKLVVDLDKVSQQAKEKIIAAGGEVKEFVAGEKKDKQKSAKKKAVKAKKATAPKKTEEKPVAEGKGKPAPVKAPESKTEKQVKTAAEKPVKPAAKTAAADAKPKAAKPAAKTQAEKTEIESAKPKEVTPKTEIREAADDSEKKEATPKTEIRDAAADSATEEETLKTQFRDAAADSAKPETAEDKKETESKDTE